MNNETNRTEPDNDDSVIRVHGLTKYFPVGRLSRKALVHAVENVSFSISRGEVVSLVGESGSGKSTTARLIARLIQPTRGEIFFKGENVLKTEPNHASLSYRSKVQMIFQDPFSSLNPTQTVDYHLSRPLWIHKKVTNQSEMRDRQYQLLEIVGLTPPEEISQQFPHQLSGGQRQRVAIARALAVDPEIILADEPISMLDVSIRMGILNLIERLKDERGIGYLYITHDIASARYIGSQIIVMYAGQMVEGAPSEDLVHAPSHPYTQLLLSAVPNPHAGLATRKIAERGEVASLIDPPPGCPFAPRCPRVMEICRVDMPAKIMVGNDRWVRCHLYQS